MSITVLLIIIAALIGLNMLRLPILAWMLIWPAAVYCFIVYGISPPVPVSVLQIYFWLTVGGCIAYLAADTERCSKVLSQLSAFMTDKKYTVPLGAVVIFLPVAWAGKIYMQMNEPISSATFGRTVHPAPPDEITFKGKQISLTHGKNPYRALEQDNPEEFAKHVANGKRVYYQNCAFCHGDDMAGDGLFAHGLTPVPANFNSPTTIAMLQESYLFWRIATGGPGLPAESGPWSSSMPAWEKFLSEDEIWDVIIYLYEYTGFNPRAEESH